MNDRLHLFTGFGVELEYMIVDAETLDIAPRADLLLRDELGAVESEIEVGDLAWSNELTAHVIELKTNGPADSLAGLADLFQDHVRRMNAALGEHGLRLMPSAMHPWMDPHAELVLWPHEYGPVYETFHRIFDCRGHGWANLQSAHVNLPFADDDEFRRLHAAIRLVLPLIPALAAASPIVDAKVTGLLDTRLDVYRRNARRIPSVTGHVIPERADSEAHYETEILGRIYGDMAELDPEGILRHEWVNARGAIARFDRGTIEIRVIDVQEHPAADLAILAATVAVLRALASADPLHRDAQHAADIEPLAQILRDTTQNAERAVIRDRSYLDLLDVPGTGTSTAGDVWRHLVDRHGSHLANGEWAAPLDVLLTEGCLARRLLGRVPDGAGRDALADVYRALCDCLEDGASFRAAS